MIRINKKIIVSMTIALLAQVAFADNDVGVDNAVIDGIVVDETVIKESFIDETVIDETVINESIIDETVIDETVISEQVITESVNEPANELVIDEPVVAEETAVNEPRAARSGGGNNNRGGGGGGRRERERPEGTDFRFSGILETGFDVHHRVNNSGESSTENRTLARGEIDISARPIRRLRAEIGLEYNQRNTEEVRRINDTSRRSDDTSVVIGPYVTIDKFYAQYSPSREGTIRAGIMKKSFGLEERAGASERYFYRRSTINSELEELQVDDIADVGFLGHDLTLMYRHDLRNDVRLLGAYSWSMDDSLIIFQNYAASYTRDSLFVVLAAIVRHHLLPDSANTTFAASLSARYATQRAIGEAEFTLAKHPWFARHYDFNSYFYGLRLQGQFPFEIETETLRRIIPLAEIALLYKDVPDERFDRNANLYLANTYQRLDTQFRVGLTLAFTKNSQFQWRNTFGTILRMQTDDNDEWEFRDWRRYRFDSQAVVIF